MSIQTSVLKTLRNGKQFTASQMATLFRTSEASVAARVAELRAQGFSIYTNTTKSGKLAYRLGTPSRRMVATAYASAGNSVFN